MTEQTEIETEEHLTEEAVGDYMAAQLGKMPPCGPMPELERCRCGILCVAAPCRGCRHPAVRYLTASSASTGPAARRRDTRAAAAAAALALAALAFVAHAVADAPARPTPGAMVAQ